MTEKDPENAVATWKAPECPFTIEYSLRVLDDIRLAVMDAFFSLPRGGAEIGGILLGQFVKRRLAIADYVPLDCEHAFGPSFTLSPRDQARLAALLASAEQNPDRLAWRTKAPTDRVGGSANIAPKGLAQGPSFAYSGAVARWTTFACLLASAAPTGRGAERVEQILGKVEQSYRSATSPVSRKLAGERPVALSAA